MQRAEPGGSFARSLTAAEVSLVVTEGLLAVAGGSWVGTAAVGEQRREVVMIAGVGPDQTRQRIEDGERKLSSIGGSAEREQVRAKVTVKV